VTGSHGTFLLRRPSRQVDKASSGSNLSLLFPCCGSDSVTSSSPQSWRRLDLAFLSIGVPGPSDPWSVTLRFCQFRLLRRIRYVSTQFLGGRLSQRQGHRCRASDNWASAAEGGTILPYHVLVPQRVEMQEVAASFLVSGRTSSDRHMPSCRHGEKGQLVNQSLFDAIPACMMSVRLLLTSHSHSYSTSYTSGFHSFPPPIFHHAGAQGGGRPPVP
jgi:hypothetical protein